MNPITESGGLGLVQFVVYDLDVRGAVEGVLDPRADEPVAVAILILERGAVGEGDAVWLRARPFLAW